MRKIHQFNTVGRTTQDQICTTGKFFCEKKFATSGRICTRAYQRNELALAISSVDYRCILCKNYASSLPSSAEGTLHITSSSASSSPVDPTPSSQPRKTSGYRDDRLQIIVRRPRFSKFDSVTPRYFVSTAPISVPTADAPLKMLMSVANKTASTPGGHILAARTSVGRNANSPKIARATSSPKTKASSGMPSDLLACEIKRSWDSPRGVDAIDVQNSISFMATLRRNL
mmetsp:Transcript_23425/g.36084  ORF Transcript_23425/g.36084 Transcript_23425/m.36084 type:complete len:229 (+) Transcript_23425:3251-3937(+)